MPKSKRAQKISLTRTKGKGHARKETLLEEVHVCCDTFSSCYAFDAANMRNTALKEVRVQLRGSRLFFGRTKLLTAALGRTPESEYKDGLSEVAASLAGGEAGLIFTNEPHATVERVLKETQTNEFARAGRDARSRAISRDFARDVARDIASILACGLAARPRTRSRAQ